jgi:hypothetical protein
LREIFKNQIKIGLLGGRMAGNTNDVVERLFDAYRLAMNIADESWNVDTTRFIETTYKLVLRIVNDIGYAMELMEKQYGIKIPEKVWKEMDELDEEYEELTEQQ